jgi:hypothetical protein
MNGFGDLGGLALGERERMDGLRELDADDMEIETAAQKAKEVAGMSKGEVKGKAHEVAGEAKGKANELAGEAKGKKEEIKGKL